MNDIERLLDILNEDGAIPEFAVTGSSVSYHATIDCGNPDLYYICLIGIGNTPSSAIAQLNKRAAVFLEDAGD